MFPKITQPSHTVSALGQHTLRLQLEDGAPNLLVVDVRDEDFEPGTLKISGSLHFPSGGFGSASCEEIFRIGTERSSQPAPVSVVFHCAMSKVRGPSCAMQFLNWLGENAPGCNWRISVLSGGMRQWSENFSKNGNLCEPIRLPSRQ